MKARLNRWGLCLTLMFLPSVALAADLEGTLQNLVNAFTSRILPIVSVGYLGKNVFSHIQNDPNATRESIRIVIAVVCLMGLAGVWNFITSQVR